MRWLGRATASITVSAATRSRLIAGRPHLTDCPLPSTWDVLASLFYTSPTSPRKVAAQYAIPYNRRSLVLSLLLTGCGIGALAQEQSLSDARRMDLVGPVKSVSVTRTQTGVVWNQPGGPTMVAAILCSECEFDPNGNRTKYGQMIDGRFQGRNYPSSS
jgi:hypothetical protein